MEQHHKGANSVSPFPALTPESPDDGSDQQSNVTTTTSRNRKKMVEDEPEVVPEVNVDNILARNPLCRLCGHYYKSGEDFVRHTREHHPPLALQQQQQQSSGGGGMPLLRSMLTMNMYPRASTGHNLGPQLQQTAQQQHGTVNNATTNSQQQFTSSDHHQLVRPHRWQQQQPLAYNCDSCNTPFPTYDSLWHHRNYFNGLCAVNNFYSPSVQLLSPPVALQQQRGVGVQQQIPSAGAPLIPVSSSLPLNFAVFNNAPRMITVPPTPNTPNIPNEMFNYPSLHQHQQAVSALKQQLHQPQAYEERLPEQKCEERKRGKKKKKCACSNCLSKEVHGSTPGAAKRVRSTGDRGSDKENLSPEELARLEAREWETVTGFRCKVCQTRFQTQKELVLHASQKGGCSKREA